ncbi:NACHT nucleoside triphosphatase, partial [Penicillium diatomitis]
DLCIEDFPPWRHVRRTTRKWYNAETLEKIKRCLLDNSQCTFLRLTLTSRRHALKTLETFPAGLDTLYQRIFDRSCSKCTGRSHCLSWALYSKDAAKTTMTSVLSQRLLQLRSAKDFLLQDTSAQIPPRGLVDEHYQVFSQSLKVLHTTLRHDIYDIKFSGISAFDIITPSPDPLAPAKYACILWADHLDACMSSAEETHCWLQEKYIYWIEALSILRNVSHGIKAMNKLEQLCQKNETLRGVLERARDVLRFIQYFATGIEISPLQLYLSPLIFSPAKSLTGTTFLTERPDWISSSPPVEEHWSPCLHIVEGHPGEVYLIAWSPDGDKLASTSASTDRTICIFDAVTGQNLVTLKEHTHSVSSLAWCPNGSRIALGLENGMIWIWESSTGEIICELGGGSRCGRRVKIIAWSPDGSRLVFEGEERTIWVWNPSTDQLLTALRDDDD